MGTLSYSPTRYRWITPRLELYPFNLAIGANVVTNLDLTQFQVNKYPCLGIFVIYGNAGGGAGNIGNLTTVLQTLPGLVNVADFFTFYDPVSTSGYQTFSCVIPQANIRFTTTNTTSSTWALAGRLYLIGVVDY